MPHARKKPKRRWVRCPACGYEVALSRQTRQIPVHGRGCRGREETDAERREREEEEFYGLVRWARRRLRGRAA